MKPSYLVKRGRLVVLETEDKAEAHNVYQESAAVKLGVLPLSLTVKIGPHERVIAYRPGTSRITE